MSFYTNVSALGNSILFRGISNDGKRFDPLNKFIKKYSPLSILVEPIKKDFIDLKDNYKDQKNIFFENSAISVNDSINYLYKVNDTKLKFYDDTTVNFQFLYFKSSLKLALKLASKLSLKLTLLYPIL